MSILYNENSDEKNLWLKNFINEFLKIKVICNCLHLKNFDPSRPLIGLGYHNSKG